MIQIHIYKGEGMCVQVCDNMITTFEVDLCPDCLEAMARVLLQNVEPNDAGTHAGGESRILVRTWKDGEELEPEHVQIRHEHAYMDNRVLTHCRVILDTSCVTNTKYYSEPNSISASHSVHNNARWDQPVIQPILHNYFKKAGTSRSFQFLNFSERGPLKLRPFCRLVPKKAV